MENNRVYLKGRLCHNPHHLRTRSQRLKIVFRLAIPRPRHAHQLPLARPLAAPAHAAVQPSRRDDLPLADEADFVTIVLLGRAAAEFSRYRLERGGWVSVEGRLRSWDRPSFRTKGVLEVVGEQVHPCDEQRHPFRPYRQPARDVRA